MSVPRPRTQIQPRIRPHQSFLIQRLPLEGRAEEGKREKGNSYTLKVAQRNFLATLTANAAWSYGGQQFPLAPNWIAGVSLTVPVFDSLWFSQLNEAVAHLAAARANEDTIGQNIVLEVQQSYADLVSAKESIQAAQVLVQQARENLELAQGGYQVEVRPLIDVTDAQLAFTQAESPQIQAFVNFKRAEARLRKATGAVERVAGEL